VNTCRPYDSQKFLGATGPVSVRWFQASGDSKIISRSDKRFDISLLGLPNILWSVSVCAYTCSMFRPNLNTSRILQGSFSVMSIHRASIAKPTRVDENTSLTTRKGTCGIQTKVLSEGEGRNAKGKVIQALVDAHLSRRQVQNEAAQNRIGENTRGSRNIKCRAYIYDHPGSHVRYLYENLKIVLRVPLKISSQMKEEGQSYLLNPGIHSRYARDLNILRRMPPESPSTDRGKHQFGPCNESQLSTQICPYHKPNNLATLERDQTNDLL
jgi:hypothetical protein